MLPKRINLPPNIKQTGDMQKIKKPLYINIVLLSIIAAVVFWIVDIFIDSYLFKEGTIFEQLLDPNPMEIYFRVAVGSLFIILGIVSQRMQNQMVRIQKELQMANEALEQKVKERTKELEEINTELERELCEHEVRQEKINYLSFHDKLTGLYNRDYYEEEIRRMNTERFLPISIIIGDINGLKLVNDAFGHLQGDKLLIKTARMIKQNCRKSDIVARWGGDEFAILLPNTPAKSAVNICDKIRRACSQSQKKPVQLSIALGTATKTDKNQDMDKVLKKAEDWMYQYKMAEGKTVRNRILNSLERTLWESAYETDEHAKHLREYLLKMALELKLPDSQVDELLLLAAFHDVGKISIPHEILSKPDKLTPKEWETVKKHSEIGYRIALVTPELVGVADYILHHHEWWDGTGYPEGLQGEQIPLQSRVLSIAEAYDIKRSARPYKSAMPKKQALQEIKEAAGKQFDPQLVKVFLKLISAKKNRG